eukprot:TRINITY_DN14604_c0_g1_i2.p1 TRINITY_DN14604_c0_g1~~TRINITY_DN14604_c0_g1_i2.p1  ORF type:complete len:595 (-),score=100.23 TRINITY_DN14604_c0_g1_i2:201-1910(-)
MGCGASTKSDPQQASAEATDTSPGQEAAAKPEAKPEAASAAEAAATPAKDAAEETDEAKEEVKEGKKVVLHRSAAPPPGSTEQVCCGFAGIRGHRKSEADKAPRKKKPKRTLKEAFEEVLDPARWSFDPVTYSGAYTYSKEPPVWEEFQLPIAGGIEELKDKPDVYEGIMYQSGMQEWPEDQQSYSMLMRTNSGFRITPEEGGTFTFIPAKYKVLEPTVDVDPDEYTDAMSQHGVLLSETLSPGRGQGLGDIPSLKLFGDVEPSDVRQGKVGDCWLLSAISALAEFDGTIRHIFKNTPSAESMPQDAFNKYTVTLFDLSSWEPTDVVVDERLFCSPCGNGLLGTTPSKTGEMWVPYLEKAVAAHCGGWDKIDGGQCTHAWRLMTGCKNQYTFQVEGDVVNCCGMFNPNTQEWEPMANSPHDTPGVLWNMPWPEAGGGGEVDTTLSHDEFFLRMCAFDDNNYLMCAGSGSVSSSAGIVDGHAYTVLTCVNNAGGTEIDLIKLRNPWGTGEFDEGKWADNGPGWTEHPEVSEAVHHEVRDDGVFWMEKEEFFHAFPTIYLCALDMMEFVAS